jgi:drug/metabolite transporter (DMT)-like permease
LRSHPLFGAYLAFASVSFFWGTTYLGIRVGLESLPPLVLVASRFLLSGSALLIALLAAKIPIPRGRDLWINALLGLMVLGVGNTCLTYAERLIPSSLAALIITLSPIWLVTMEALLPGGEKITRGTMIGLAVAICGAGVLVGPDVWTQGLSGDIVKGFLILQFGSIAWNGGSLWQRRLQAKAHPFASAAIHQLAAGLAFTPAALMETQPAVWDAKGIGAMLYLATFGSIVGYTSYIVALRSLPVAIVSLYNYINPVVAAILGWIVYREPFGRREVIAMLIIFLGVTIVKRYGHRR